MEDAVFDRPPEVGEVIWSVGWRDRDDLAGRLMLSMVTGILGCFAFGYLVLHMRSADPVDPLFLSTGVGFAALAFLLLGPDRHCMVLGKQGFAISRKRLGFRVTRRMVEFADADDIEVTYRRIVSDSVYQLYAHTDVFFTFLDRDGDEIEQIAGTIDEPALRAAGKWDPTAPIDLSDPDARDRNAQLGYAAVDWFHAFKDQRDATPYR